jgi:flagellar hook-basal body complex protein FliE
MVTNTLSALSGSLFGNSAYAATQKLTNALAANRRLEANDENSSLAGLSGVGAPKFSNMVEESVNTVLAQGRHAEVQARDALSGRGNMLELTTAVIASEASLEKLVAIRDKVIGAYEDILRMPV